MFPSCAEIENGQLLSIKMSSKGLPVAIVRIAAGTNLPECNMLDFPLIPDFIDIEESKNLQFVYEEDKIDDETPIQIYVGTESDLPAILLLENVEYEVEIDLFDEPAEVFPYLMKNSDCLKCKKFLLGDTRNKKKYALEFENYVGTGFFDVETKNHDTVRIPFEVRSKKIGYRKDYARMLADIAEYSALLLLNSKTPLYTSFNISDSPVEIQYETFLILEYLFREDWFPELYEYLRGNIKTEMKIKQEDEMSAMAVVTDQLDLIEMTAVSNLSRCDGGVIGNRYAPINVKLNTLTDTIDTPENRTIKDLLLTIGRIIEQLEVSPLAEDGTYTAYKLKQIKSRMSEYLADDWMDDVGDLTSIPYNSSTLQKRYGYAELFEMYLVLYSGIQLNDSKDLLEGHNKRMSTLYEYWAYLRLFDCLRSMSLNAPQIRPEKEGTGYSIIRDSCSEPFIIPVIDADAEIEVKLFYNRGFLSESTENLEMIFRPDYTLIVCPKTLLDKSRFIIHFDAKYKSRVLDIDSDERKKAHRRVYKSEDVHKMHTYQNAINGSWGSYVLYPGDVDKVFFEKYDFSEKLPGIPSVGVVSLMPGYSSQNLKNHLENLFKSIAKIASTVKEGDWFIELNIFSER